jgi:hypothetical protein
MKTKMLKIIGCIFLALLGSPKMWPQVEPSATGGPSSLDDTQMMAPPPLTGESYPIANETEAGRSNYLDAGLVFSTAYTDNIFQTGSSQKVGDETFAFSPTIALDRRTPRQAFVLYYNSGFTIYNHTSELNGVSQDGSANWQLRLAKYLNLRLMDTFYQNSNLYNQPNPFTTGGVSSTAGTTSIFPFENLISNLANAEIDYQFAKNSMVGAGGSYSILHYTGQTLQSSLQNQDDGRAFAFLNRRLSRHYYAGVSYEYQRITTSPVSSYTDTSSILGFLTIYLDRNFSLSFLAGPQHYAAAEKGESEANGWSPAVQSSIEWRGRRGSVAGSYSRMISNGSGLVGGYYTNTFEGKASWEMARRWTLGGDAGYSRFNPVIANASIFRPEGYTSFSSVSLTHTLTERVSAGVDYAHFHQDQSLAGSGAPYPDSNRIGFSIGYQLSRPIGR